VFEVNVSARSIDPFEPLVGKERVGRVIALADEIQRTLGDRAVWNINSTASGGGVAEMLRSVLRYVRGLGVLARWAVVQGPPEFFRVTKRIHNALHDNAGDGSALGPEEMALYERVMTENIVALDAVVRPGDVVICHDPQTAGLVPHFVGRGMHVIWRCHIGHELHGVEVDRGWSFLRKYLECVPYAVVSRGAYAPAWLPQKRVQVLPPNIDPFSVTNQAMEEPTIRAILCDVGLIDGPRGDGRATFLRDDGSVGRVERAAEILRVGRPPSWDTRLVVQVSRWDAMKDPVGVLQGFARLVEPASVRQVALVLAGPTVSSVADDPEGPVVYRRVEQVWHELPDSLRSAVHLAQLPMQDVGENAAIVNALQRHATVIVQKSLREGFGLTVTEGMWKRRPVIASAVGGIQDQIRDRIDGLLVHDPTDLGEFAGLLRNVLADPVLGKRLGDAAYERVRENYLTISSLEQWALLVKQLFANGAQVGTRLAG
jgi:trehalose synthase